MSASSTVAPRPAIPLVGSSTRVLRALALVLLAYWGLLALLVPVTTVDSQMYNLARLELVVRGGFWDNPLWTNAYQICWPWSFDATHLPFLFLGFAYSLPSFLCFAGTCFVTHQLLKERFGLPAAWTGVLALLAMPCLVYQSVSTKNDLAVLFGGAVWLYSLIRYKREGGAVHLVWLCLSLGFMAGAKTSGLIPAFLLGLWSLYEVRAVFRHCVLLCVSAAVSVLLLGSVETYVLSYKKFGHPLGPAQILHLHANPDGVRGAASNLFRYSVGTLAVVPEEFSVGKKANESLASFAQAGLAASGLQGKGGGGDYKEADLAYHNLRLEEFASYGVPGALALLLLLVSPLCLRGRGAWRVLGVAGLTGLLILCYTAGYRHWNSRYLLPWLALGLLGWVCLLWQGAEQCLRPAPRWRQGLRFAFVAMLALHALAAPFLSFNRGPEALLFSFTQRQALKTSSVPIMGALIGNLQDLHRERPSARFFLVVHQATPILPFLDLQQPQITFLNPAQVERAIATGLARPGDVIAEDYPSGSARLSLLREVSAPNVYSENQDTLVRRIYTVLPR